MTLYDVWNLLQNNIIVGEDGMSGTDVNRTDECWSWATGTCFLFLYMFKISKPLIKYILNIHKISIIHLYI